MTNLKIATFPQQAADICWASSLIYTRGLVCAAGGNISSRCNDVMLITGTNVSLRNVQNKNLALCDLQGIVLDAAEGTRPSKEMKFHSGIYLVRPQVQCIIHAHPCYSTVWSMQHKQLPMYTESAKLKLKQVPIISDAKPGTQELADSVINTVSEASDDVTAFLLANHGIIVLGKTMEECINTTELLEDTAKIAVYQELLTHARS